MPLEEITLIFSRECYRKESGTDESDWVILECERPEGGQQTMFDLPPKITVTTTANADELEPRLSYRFYGQWDTYKGERQFQAKTFVRCQPHGKEGIIRYLKKAPNVGHATATKLWEKFGGDAVRILRETPDVASAAAGKYFKLPLAEEAAAWLKRESALEDCFIELIDLLSGFGFPKNTAKKAVQEWGNRAAEFIKFSPYHLMSFRGCGFLRCDKLYLELGHEPARLKRQAYCSWYALARNTEGHTWFPSDEVEKGLRDMVGGTQRRPVDAVKLAVKAKLLGKYRNGQLWLAEGKKDRQEKNVAECVADMLLDEGDWPEIEELNISEHQGKQLGRACINRIGVFSGSPGTGKTYSSARLIKSLIHLHGKDNVAVCAPTGKAAVRITELMTEYSVPVRATTIHSLLGVAQNSQVEGWSFQHNKDNPLDVRYVIVDESSMIDTTLMSSLLSAIPPYGHVLFVGDPNQLPPVGHGAPLRDFIAAGVPTGELREIRRNSGSIVRTCAAIRDAERWEPDERVYPLAGFNLGLLPANSGQAACERILKAVRKIKEQEQVDPVWDVQIIVAVNQKSDLSRTKLNLLLQAELNPLGLSARGNPFRVNDKIVCLKNGLLETVDEDGSEGLPVFVANGELGRVVGVQEKLTVAEFDGNRRVRIPRGQKTKEDESEEEEKSTTGCNFDLGYAISAHKSQGAEFPVVLVALDDYPGALRVCSREWIYTAISRAKQVCFLVGKMGTARMMCNRQALKQRRTFLAERIAEQLDLAENEVTA